jgi:hypothetical protein
MQTPGVPGSNAINSSSELKPQMQDATSETKPHAPRPVAAMPDARNGPFAIAVESARTGRYSEAVRLLDQAVDAGDCSETEALDLRARMFAQQGLLLDAERCWREAQELNGSNPAFKEGLDYLRRRHSSREPLKRGLLIAAAVLIPVLWFWRTDAIEANRREQIVQLEGKLVQTDKALTALLTQLTERIAVGEIAQRQQMSGLAERVAEADDAMTARVAQLAKRIARAESNLRDAINRGVSVAELRAAIAGLATALAEQANARMSAGQSEPPSTSPSNRVLRSRRIDAEEE